MTEYKTIEDAIRAENKKGFDTVIMTVTGLQEKVSNENKGVKFDIEHPKVGGEDKERTLTIRFTYDT